MLRIKMLRLAYENNKLLRLPVIHKLKVNNVRQGFFEWDMFERVCRYLPDDYTVAVTIDNTYGWRTQSEGRHISSGARNHQER